MAVLHGTGRTGVAFNARSPRAKSPGRRTGAKGLWGSLADSNNGHFASCIPAAEFPPKHIRSAAEAGTAGGLCAAALWSVYRVDCVQLVAVETKSGYFDFFRSS